MIFEGFSSSKDRMMKFVQRLRGNLVLLELMLCWVAQVNLLGLSVWKKVGSGVLNDPTT